MFNVFVSHLNAPYCACLHAEICKHRNTLGPIDRKQFTAQTGQLAYQSALMLKIFQVMLHKAMSILSILLTDPASEFLIEQQHMQAQLL